MVTTDPTHYEVLGVDPTATDDEIKRAYRSAMKKHHPDLAHGPEHERMARLITEANSVLLSWIGRKDYDAKLRSEGRLEEEVRYSYSEPSKNAPRSESPRRAEAPRRDIPLAERVWGDEGTEGYSPGDPIQKMPKADVPENFINKKPRFYSGAAAVRTPILVSLAALITIFVFFPKDGITYGLTIASLFLSVLVFFKHSELREPVRIPWWVTPVIGAVMGGGLTVGILLFPSLAPAFAIAGYGIAPLSMMIGGRVFWSRFNQSQMYLKPKSLKNNNSFGTVDPGSIDNSLDEVLNCLWDVKGMRVLRCSHESFSHMVIFDKRVVLLKAVSSLPGSMSMFEGAVYNQSGPERIDKIVGSDFMSGLFRFTANAPKKAEVTSMVVVYPAESLLSFTPDPQVTFVAADDAAALIAQVLFREGAKNRVDYSMIVDLMKAANS